ncbi:branched-chain amino acid ABC transporter permease [Amorphus orientalis]|uniref:Branched-chain amino acid transport system permease protein n=1 Tax=Amorphus orientalis TaxID=649198 RepID=A0AAE4AS07_9HYPH|nr:branched-chain amino acid ABC transporter permease [Amorphus orientalis]MDQ0314713.1 branched-chain amino acid transport system permease protein [Amorphus orientalis]
MKLTLSRWQLHALEIAFWLTLAACFFIFPDRLYLLTQILIAALFAISLDIALGYAGILTLGHAVFFGLGAYAAGLLAKAGWAEPLSGLVLAFLLCGLIAYVLSVLVVNATELTQLMVTIAVGAIFAEVANQATSITGGSDGLQGISMWPIFGMFSFDLWGKTAFIYAFVVVLLCFLLVRRLLQSPFGLALKGIHGNRKRMHALGSPVSRRLRFAYAVSAALAGVAGALLAQTTEFVGLDTLSIDRSAMVLIILVLGGTGRLYGGIIGAIVYMVVHDVFADLSPEYWMFWLGLFLMAIVMIGSGGILGGLSRFVRTDRT